MEHYLAGGGTDKDEMLTVFAGTESLKTGTANVFIDEFASMLNAGNLDTFTDKAKRQKGFRKNCRSVHKHLLYANISVNNCTEVLVYVHQTIKTLLQKLKS